MAIHKNWMFHDFNFLKGGDPLTGYVAGNQARMITVQYFLMHEELRSFMNGKWKRMEEFKDVVEFNAANLDHETQIIQEKKIEHALTHMLCSIEKHFDPWVNHHLFLCLYSEAQTAQVVASFLLDEKFQGPEYFTSTIHQQIINVRRFEAFLKERCFDKG